MKFCRVTGDNLTEVFPIFRDLSEEGGRGGFLGPRAILTDCAEILLVNWLQPSQCFGPKYSYGIPGPFDWAAHGYFEVFHG